MVLVCVGGGHYNHSLFWKWMAPVGTSHAGPFGVLKEAIDANFGSFEAFRTQFSDAAVNRFGSGWAWLNVDPANPSSLFINSTANQGAHTRQSLHSGLV